MPWLEQLKKDADLAGWYYIGKCQCGGKAYKFKMHADTSLLLKVWNNKYRIYRNGNVIDNGKREQITDDFNGVVSVL